MRILLLTGVLVSTITTSAFYPSVVKDSVSLDKWLQENFTYQAEEGDSDYWKKPLETFKDKGGDCEDLSIMNKKILTDLGYKAYLVVMANKESGHAICLFKEKDGTYSFFDNTYYADVKVKDWRSILKNYKDYHQFYNCNENKICTKLYRNKDNDR